MDLLLYLYILACLIHLSYWITFFFAFRFYSSPAKYRRNPPVSVVVCFKNEQNNIRQLLEFLLSQQYPVFEIIMVDDHSKDATSSIIAACEDPRIKMVKAHLDIPGKKAALQTGIEHAHYNVIAVTDADCKGSPMWLSHMVNAVPAQGCCLGYAPLIPSKNMVSLFAAYETWLAAVQYLSYAILKNPYMGVGRNMAYSKDFYNKAGGYASHEDLMSGDDDLLVNAAANAVNTAVQLHPESFVYSDTSHTVSQFIKQKSRHLKASTRYRWNHKTLLFIFSFTQIILYTGLALAIIVNFSIPGIPLIFLALLVIKYFLSLPMIKMLKAPFLKLYLPLMDAFYYFYLVIMTPLFLFKKDNTWK